MRTRADLARLYDEHAPRLYAIALKIAGDGTSACAALEEAFIALWDNADSVREPLPWLIRATREFALARQTRSAAPNVLASDATPRRIVEDAWYGGLNVNDLAKRYGISESSARTLLRDGLVELRGSRAAATS